MLTPLVWCSAARRSLCSSQVSRRTSAYYSQSAACCIQDPVTSISASTGARTLSETWTNSHTAIANSRNPLDPTRLDRYLASIKTVDLEPTMDDIERCRPKTFSPPDSSRYAGEYTNLLETLCRSFSKDQLRRFTELYKLDPVWTRSSRRKTEYAESIMEKVWGWPSLKEIERKRRDTTEVLVKTLTVTPSQLFLMMGTDGADLLQLSTQFNVHISLTSNPLALRVEGLRGSLKRMTEYVSSLKKDIIDEIFEIPTGRPVQPYLLQRVSRLTGAYVENHGHRGKVRICAKHPANITAAKRLALRASLEGGTQPRTVCFDSPNKIRGSPVETSGSRRYSLYPFVTPSSFPWTMHSGGAFRLRRVADWLGVNSYEDIALTGGLADNPHCLLNFDGIKEELGQLTCSTTSESTLYAKRSITVSLGHILISSNNNSQRTTIFPPLRGILSLLDLLKWTEISGTTLTFVPSVPPAVMTVAAGKQRFLRRLVYRSLPEVVGQALKPSQRVLKFEMELAGPSSTAVRGPKSAWLDDIPSSVGPGSSADSVLLQGDVFDTGSFLETMDCDEESGCQVGSETYINLMLPDRPMDLQLCIFDWNDLTLVQQPQVLREYAEKFRFFLTNSTGLSQPDPPSTFTYAGKTYYLHDSLSLRRSSSPSLLSTARDDLNADDSVKIYNECIKDLQSAQRLELCQMKCNYPTDGPSWKRFLTACDQLSVVSLHSQGKDKSPPVYLEK